MIKLFLARGAAVYGIVEDIGSTLCCAGRVAYFDSALLFIEAAADLGSVENVGHSALHIVIFRSQSGIELFDYFLGADPLLPDRRG